MTATASVSVIIVSWNVREYLRRCLSSLSGDVEILETIVVDNGSSDGTQDVISDEFPNVRLINAPGNVGFPRANNLGMERAKGDLILLLNPDTDVVPGAVASVARALRGDDSADVAGCRLLLPNGQDQPEAARGLPTLWSVFAEGVFLHSLAPSSRVFNGRLTKYPQRAQQFYVECICGAFMMVRRSAIESHGGLDEQFFMYYEDFELCARTWSHGRRVLYVGEAIVVHFGGRSRARSSAPLDMLAGPIHEAYFRRYRGAGAAAMCRALFALRGAARLVLALILIPLWAVNRSMRTKRIFNWRAHMFDLMWGMGVVRGAGSGVRGIGAQG